LWETPLCNLCSLLYGKSVGESVCPSVRYKRELCKSRDSLNIFNVIQWPKNETKSWKISMHKSEFLACFRAPHKLALSRDLDPVYQLRTPPLLRVASTCFALDGGKWKKQEYSKTLIFYSSHTNAMYELSIDTNMQFLSSLRPQSRVL